MLSTKGRGFRGFAWAGAGCVCAEGDERRGQPRGWTPAARPAQREAREEMAGMRGRRLIAGRRCPTECCRRRGEDSWGSRGPGGVACVPKAMCGVANPADGRGQPAQPSAEWAEFLARGGPSGCAWAGVIGCQPLRPDQENGGGNAEQTRPVTECLEVPLVPTPLSSAGSRRHQNGSLDLGETTEFFACSWNLGLTGDGCVALRQFELAHRLGGTC